MRGNERIETHLRSFSSSSFRSFFLFFLFKRRSTSYNLTKYQKIVPCQRQKTPFPSLCPSLCSSLCLSLCTHQTLHWLHNKPSPLITWICKEDDDDCWVTGFGSKRKEKNRGMRDSGSDANDRQGMESGSQMKSNEKQRRHKDERIWRERIEHANQARKGQGRDHRLAPCYAWRLPLSLPLISICVWTRETDKGNRNAEKGEGNDPEI